MQNMWPGVGEFQNRQEMLRNDIFCTNPLFRFYIFIWMYTEPLQETQLNIFPRHFDCFKKITFFIRFPILKLNIFHIFLIYVMFKWSENILRPSLNIFPIE